MIILCLTGGPGPGENGGGGGGAGGGEPRPPRRPALRPAGVLAGTLQEGRTGQGYKIFVFSYNYHSKSTRLSQVIFSRTCYDS